jgi:ATP-binding cassette subfamily D (ALD) long-chain fatty acid import protein
VNEFAGYTSRVYDMISVFQDVQNGIYHKQLVASSTADTLIAKGFKILQLLLKFPGKVFESPNIEFSEVPIVSPNGDILIEKMSFLVKPGMHTLITGNYPSLGITHN